MAPRHSGVHNVQNDTNDDVDDNTGSSGYVTAGSGECQERTPEIIAQTTPTGTRVGHHRVRGSLLVGMGAIVGCKETLKCPVRTVQRSVALQPRRWQSRVGNRFWLARAAPAYCSDEITSSEHLQPVGPTGPTSLVGLQGSNTGSNPVGDTSRGCIMMSACPPYHRPSATAVVFPC